MGDGKDAAVLAITYRELVRITHPDADDDRADWLLWERTPFPVEMDGNAILRYLRDHAAGRFHCPRCGWYVPTDDGDLCVRCDKALRREIRRDRLLRRLRRFLLRSGVGHG